MFIYKYQGFGLIAIHESSSEVIDRILSSCSLIAHAGGGIDGVKYTNSKEALLQSIDTGYRLIEIDLLVSSDGEILGAHDWERYIGQLITTETPPKRTEFISTKYQENIQLWILI